MVTLAGTQNFSEFELHARAILGLPVAEIAHHRNGASAVVLAPEGATAGVPFFSGLAAAAAVPKSDIRLFGKPALRPHRRMGVALAYGTVSDGVEGWWHRPRKLPDTLLSQPKAWARTAWKPSEEWIYLTKFPPHV